jgi:copper oxidase (laccase) domain-containing protein
MQLIGLLIFIGILVLLLVFAIYLARGEKFKNSPYGSWSNVLGPQFRGSAYDVGEKLKEEIEEGQQHFRKGRRPRHSKEKKK